MSFSELLPILFQLILVTGIAFVVICLLTSYLRFQQMAARAAEVTPEDADGLGAFHVRIAERLGTAHRSALTFCLLAVEIHSYERLRDELDDASLNDLCRWVADTIHRGTRGSDTVVRIAEDRFGMLVGAGRQTGREIAQRIVAPFRELDFHAAGDRALHVPVHVAAVVSPDAGTRVGELMAALQETLTRSRAEGEGAVVVAGEEEPAGAAAPVPTPADPLAAVAPNQRKLVDPLTGVLRQDLFEGVLHKRVARRRRDGQPVSIICLQLDHLDRYRDHYGEEGIQAILSHFGAFLQRAVREDDLLARHGEEQFAMIMDCAPAQAQTAAQRLVEGIRREEVRCGEASLKVTLSAGVAGFPAHGGVAKKLLECASLALEAALTRGRNQSRLFSKDLEIPQAREQRGNEF